MESAEVADLWQAICLAGELVRCLALAGQNCQKNFVQQSLESGTNPMLVLSRKKNESIIIGDDIEISIVEIRSGKIKIGVQAPRSVRVLREEIIHRPPNSEDDNAFTDGNLMNR